MDIAIIGAGMSGICMAIQLKQAGFENFRIFEKADRIGGTWRDNTYPGLTCDVPSHFYSYSFELNPDWSRLYSPGHEIQSYFEHCVEKYDLKKHILFNSEIESAEFEDGRWSLQLAKGIKITAQIIITAVGLLHNPKLPDVPGLKSFRGTSFHSSAWSHSRNLKGHKVAVIGSAASAVQIIPEIAPLADQLSVFQRTPNWVKSRPDRAYSERRKRWFHRLPLLTRLHRWSLYWSMESVFPVFKNYRWANGRARQVCLDHLDSQIPDPKLRKALTPNYPPGCKRILISDDFFPTLLRDNVELVTTPIEHIVPEGIVTQGGRTRAFDTIIFATGFQASRFFAPMSVTGRDGQSLDEVWRSRAEAHRGVAVPGFPNFFILFGPNTALGHSSSIFMVEAQAHYILQCLQRMKRDKLNTLEPREKAARRYNAKLQRSMKKTVWQAGCRSWYQNDNGEVVLLWPSSTIKFWWTMRRPKFREYDGT